MTQCNVCFRQCNIPEGQLGFCKTKKCENGQIIDRGYGKITSAALDPIEKKPLARFYPGRNILSFGSYGCSLRCPFCQNWEISQQDLDNQSETVTPQMLVNKAIELKPYNNIGLAATYNETSLSPDFIRDTFSLLKETAPDMKTVMVTSGCNTLEALEEYLPYTDAFNIDLKGFTPQYYKWVGGDLETTKEYIKRAAKDAHVELTMLVVPGKNDSVEDMEKMAKWIADIDPNIPLHLSRYFPRYKCDIEITPAETLYKLKDTAGKYLNYVFLGNI